MENKNEEHMLIRVLKYFENDEENEQIVQKLMSADLRTSETKEEIRRLCKESPFTEEEILAGYIELREYNKQFIGGSSKNRREDQKEFAHLEDYTTERALELEGMLYFDMQFRELDEEIRKNGYTPGMICRRKQMELEKTKKNEAR